MAEKLMFVNVSGEHHKWSFSFYGDPKYIPEWRADGLEVFEIEYSIPAGLPSRLTKAWCFVQDTINLRNPWRK